MWRNATGFCPRSSSAATRSAAAPHHGANTRQQLADPEGFRQIVVGPAVQSEHLVRLVAARGEHEDRYVAVRGIAPYRPADGQPVNPRQHQVEHDEIERLPPGEVEPLDPGSGSDAFECLRSGDEDKRDRGCSARPR